MIENKQTKSSSVMKGAMILSIGVLVSRIIGLLYRVPIRNILGDEGNGIYGVAYNLYVVILTLTAMAMPGALSKLLAERRTVKAYREEQRVFKVAMIYSVGFATVMSILLWIFADAINSKMYPTMNVTLPLRALAPTIVIATFLGVFRGYFQGRQNMVPTALSQVIEQIFNVIFSVVLAYAFMKMMIGDPSQLEWGATGSALGTGVGAVAGFIVLIIMFMMSRKETKRELQESTEYKDESTGTILKQILAMMIPVIISSSIFSITTAIDQSMISKSLGASIEALRNENMLNYVPIAEAPVMSTDSIVRSLSGILSFQYMTFLNIPVSLILQIGLASIPAISAANKQGNLSDVQDKTKMILKVGLLIAAPCAFAFIFFAAPILKLLTGDVSGAEVLSAGAVAIIPIAVAQVSAGILQGITKQTVPTVNAIIACAIKIAINFVALAFPKLNIYGFVHSSTVCYIIYAVLNMVSIQKNLKLRINWANLLIKPTICSAIMGILSYGVYRLILMTGVGMRISIIIVIPIAVVIYLVIGILSKTITREDMLSIPGGSKLVKLLKM